VLGLGLIAVLLADRVHPVSQYRFFTE